MTSDQWKRVQVIFDSLIELSPAQRSEALVRCADSETDAGVLEEVERLLLHADQSIFIDSAIPGLSTACNVYSGRVPDGFILGNRFEVTGFLGRGGMGEVYQA